MSPRQSGLPQSTVTCPLMILSGQSSQCNRGLYRSCQAAVLHGPFSREKQARMTAPPSGRRLSRGHHPMPMHNAAWNVIAHAV
jgi:hypothetical protein